MQFFSKILYSFQDFSSHFHETCSNFCQYQGHPAPFPAAIKTLFRLSAQHNPFSTYHIRTLVSGVTQLACLFCSQHRSSQEYKNVNIDYLQWKFKRRLTACMSLCQRWRNILLSLTKLEKVYPLYIMWPLMPCTCKRIGFPQARSFVCFGILFD